jgi:hypothetical protein
LVTNALRFARSPCWSGTRSAAGEFGAAAVAVGAEDVEDEVKEETEEEEEEEEEEDAAGERDGDKAGVAFDEEEDGGSPPVSALRFRPGPLLAPEARLPPLPPPPSLPLPSSLQSSTRSMTRLFVFADFAVSPEVPAPLGG